MPTREAKGPQNAWVTLAGAGLGAALWIPVFWLSSRGHGDPDRIWYVVAYPVMLMASFMISRWHSVEPWGIAGLMLGGNYIVALAVVPGAGNLLPFEVLIMAMLACPLAAAAKLGSIFWRRRRRPRVGS